MAFASWLVVLAITWVASAGGRADDLHQAMINGRITEALEMIRSQDLKSLMAPVHGLTALHLAAYRGHREVCEHLLRHPKANQIVKLNSFASDSNAPGTAMRRTPLLYVLHGYNELNHQTASPQAAAKAKDFAFIVELLIQHGAKPYQRDEQGRNALQLALLFGLTDCLQHLADEKACGGVSGGVTTDIRSVKGWNNLHFAAYTSHRWKMMSNMLLKESTGWKSVRDHFAVVWDSVFLTMSPSQLDQHVIHRDDVWSMCAQHSVVLLHQLVSQCSHASSDWNPARYALQPNANGMTPLHLLVDSGDVLTLQAMIDLITGEKEQGDLPALLHLAAYRGHGPAVDYLLSIGVYSECQRDEMGRTPSQVWHVQEPIPPALVQWEALHCLQSVDADLQSDSVEPSTVRPSFVSPEGVAIVDAKDITPEQFVRYFLSLRRPVLIRGLVSSWPALEKWSPSYFVQHYGQLPVWMGSIPYAQQFKLPGKKGPLAQYAQYLSLYNSEQGRAMMRDKPIMYVFDNEILTSQSGQSLMEDVVVPELVRSFARSGSQFMWGPEGSGAPMHHHRDAWNGLVFGRKAWWFQPPSVATSATFVSDQWVSDYRCVQEPGDFVYVPDSWSHAVYNLQDSAAVAIEFLYQ